MRSVALGAFGEAVSGPIVPCFPGSHPRRLLFGGLCLGFEAGIVLLLGAGLQAQGSVPAPQMSPAGIALAYVIVRLLSRALTSARSSTAGAALALAAVFSVAVVLSPPSLASWGVLLAWFAAGLAGVAALRAGAARLAAAMPSLHPEPRPVAFIGNSESAARMLREIEADPRRRARPIGFFDDRDRPGPLDGRLPFLGSIDDLVSFIHDHELHDVYMALPWSAGERISVLIERLRFLPLTVRLVPDQAPPALRAAEGEALEGVVMPTLMLPPFPPLGAALKRGFDILGSVLLLIPLAPLFLLVAAAIRLDSPGPIFFRQSRSGRYGRPFEIFKFRSLHMTQNDHAAETLVSHGDRRVTRVGHYLRKYSIDELPQLLNVLLGEMSLVGPRPHAPRAKADGRIYAELLPDYMLRYRVKPGMTGWAQVNGWRGNTDTEDKLRRRVEYDFAYIRNWSLARDLVILFRTIPSVMFPPPENA